MHRDKIVLDDEIVYINLKYFYSLNFIITEHYLRKKKKKHKQLVL